MVRGHVFVRQEAAVGPEVGVDGAGDVALVERVATAVGDLLQRVGKIGIPPHLASTRRAPVEGELLGEAGELRQPRHRALPVVGDRLVDRVAFARVADGGRQHIAHRQLAEATVQREPAIDRARHTHACRA